MFRSLVVAMMGIAFLTSDLRAQEESPSDKQSQPADKQSQPADEQSQPEKKTDDHHKKGKQSVYSRIDASRVTIEKKCPEKRYVGTPVKNEITIVNEGNTPALEVVVFDHVCCGAKFLKASEGGEFKDGIVTWIVGDLPAGETRSFQTTVIPQHIGELECPARAEWRALALVEDRCKTVVAGIPAILLEVVDLVDPIEVGEVETYEITVTNQGSLAGNKIVVKATLPDQLKFVSGEGPTQATAQGQVVTFGALDALAPKAKAVYTLKAKAVGVGDIRFRLDLTSQQSEEPIFETESTNIYE